MTGLPDKLRPYEGLIRRVAEPFFTKSGHDQVFVATCCGRLLVTDTRPELCGTCKKAPDVHTISPSDL